jgi:hypothetical protein
MIGIITLEAAVQVNPEGWNAYTALLKLLRMMTVILSE